MPYFTYEKDFARRWQPVVYYEKPVKSSQGHEPERSALHEISGKQLLGNDGVSPNFGRLVKKYPMPLEG